MAVNDPYGIIGEWTFNSTSSMLSTSAVTLKIDFTLNGFTFDTIHQVHGNYLSMYLASKPTEVTIGIWKGEAWSNSGNTDFPVPPVINITGGRDLGNEALANWIKANAVKTVATTLTTITYNGTELASLEEGQTATFSCEGTKAKTNVSILFGSKGSITYKGVITEIEAGKTANLLCADKKFGTDVVVAVEGATSLITFTIGDISYQAVEGMTWAEWCESEYNVDNYKAVTNGIHLAAPETPVCIELTPVNPSDMIISNFAYKNVSLGGGSN